MKIKYIINDGYVGTRTRQVHIPDADLNDCETREEKIELINTLVQEDFEQNVNPIWDQNQLP